MSEHPRPMALDEFFYRLPKQGWFLTREGRIRKLPPNAAVDLAPPLICPVCAVANHTVGKARYRQNYSDAAEIIGLPRVLAHSIACASDNVAFKDKDDIRARLLAHCGLQ